MKKTAIRYWSIFTEAIMKSSSKKTAIYGLVILLLVGAYGSTRLLNQGDVVGITLSKFSSKPQQIKIDVPLNCSGYDRTRTCPSNYPTTRPPETKDPSRPPSATCPEYFRWIHEDLRPWAETGITREMVDRAGRSADFRLVIVKGKAYVETFRRSFQTRDVFTVWGILQLLRWYPGRVPDLELMFNCGDWPLINRKDFPGPDATSLPPLFHYCADDSTIDIVFPDWSFWGWPEINIKPWVPIIKEMSEANKNRKWEEREPYAYWKGNPNVAATRQDLLKCNVSDTQDWNARLYAQDWIKETNEGFKDSNLANQCTHKYKIYVEGNAWSVSQKYILACDSPTLLVKPRFYDFLTRGLEPLKHYWPINENEKCRSIQFAVDWGNNHKEKAETMGKTMSDFMMEDVKMEYVYDFMYHVFNEYSNLMRFKPVIPEKAVELCLESMVCATHGLEKEFLVESMVTSPSESEPCSLPQSYSPSQFFSILRRKMETIEQVESWKLKNLVNQTS